MPALSTFPSRNHRNRDETTMHFPLKPKTLARHETRRQGNPAGAGVAAWTAVSGRAGSWLCFRRSVMSMSTALFVLVSLQSPALSEPSGFEPLQSSIIGQTPGDNELQAIWDGKLRPRMQTLNARFATPSGNYVLSVKKDRCVNTGNVPNLFACPARLALLSSGKPVVIRDYGQFYFSGELPTSNSAATYVEQTGRNNTRVAIDPDQGTLLVQDTNNGSTGTVTFSFTTP